MRKRLRMEALEAKDMLYNFSGWDVANPADITYSFVDGPYMNANAEEVESTITDHLSGCDDPQRQIARALQQWTDHGPFNFTKVADSSLPVPQRFQVLDAGNHGNIAIAHYLNQGSNDPAYIAKANLPTLPLGKAMDINLRGQMCNQPDRLFGVVRHEVGHTLGFYHAQGVMAGNGGLNLPDLDADTIAGIHAVYGERQPDEFDAAFSNDSWASPTFVPGGELTADLTTKTDTDKYVIQATGSTTTVEVDPTSLLSPLVLIYAGQPWPIAADGGDYAQPVNVTFPTVPGNYYGVQVLSNDPDFQIGRYDMRISQAGGGGLATAARALAIDYALRDPNGVL